MNWVSKPGFILKKIATAELRGKAILALIAGNFFVAGAASFLARASFTVWIGNIIRVSVTSFNETLEVVAVRTAVFPGKFVVNGSAIAEIGADNSHLSAGGAP